MMPTTPIKTLPAKQSGFGGITLLSVGLGLIVAAIITMNAAKASAEKVKMALASAQAQQMQVLQEGLNKYIGDNGAALIAGTAVTGVAVPASPSTDELLTLGYLAQAFSANTYYHTDYAVSITKVPAGCVADACHLTGLVWSTSSLRDDLNNALPGGQLGQIVSSGGADFGAAMFPGDITGFDGGWSVPNPVSGQPAGILAVRFGYGASTVIMSDYLKRNGTLPMTGNLNMGTHAMNNITTLTATGAVQGGTLQPNTKATVGTACPDIGAIAQNIDNTGDLLSCRANIWVKGLNQSSGPLIYKSDYPTVFYGHDAMLNTGDIYSVDATGTALYYPVNTYANKAGHPPTTLGSIVNGRLEWISSPGSPAFAKTALTLTTAGIIREDFTCNTGWIDVCRKYSEAFYAWTS